MPLSDLPFGSEFSPRQIDLAALLATAHQCGADWKAFEAAVKDRYFADYNTSDGNKAKLANNTKLSLRAYGLIGANDTALTATGKALYELRDDEARRYANRIMADSNLCVVMIDGGDLAAIAARPAAMVDIFNREARHAMDLKKLEL